MHKEHKHTGIRHLADFTLEVEDIVCARKMDLKSMPIWLGTLMDVGNICLHKENVYSYLSLSKNNTRSHLMDKHKHTFLIHLLGGAHMLGNSAYCSSCDEWRMCFGQAHTCNLSNMNMLIFDCMWISYRYMYEDLWSECSCLWKWFQQHKGITAYYWLQGRVPAGTCSSKNRIKRH